MALTGSESLGKLTQQTLPNQRRSKEFVPEFGEQWRCYCPNTRPPIHIKPHRTVKVIRSTPKLTDIVDIWGL